MKKRKRTIRQRAIWLAGVLVISSILSNTPMSTYRVLAEEMEEEERLAEENEFQTEEDELPTEEDEFQTEEDELPTEEDEPETEEDDQQNENLGNASNESLITEMKKMEEALVNSASKEPVEVKITSVEVKEDTEQKGQYNIGIRLEFHYPDSYDGKKIYGKFDIRHEGESVLEEELITSFEIDFEGHPFLLLELLLSHCWKKESIRFP